MTCTQESGTCAKCKAACSFKPGWFAPGEAEKAADLLGLSLQEFFDTCLMVDWCDRDGRDIFLLSPAVAHSAPGDMAPADPKGRCVFFVEGRCKIHEAKPLECRQFWCGEPSTNVAPRHEAVADSWRDYQQQVTELFGGQPWSSEYIGGPFGLMGDE